MPPDQLISGLMGLVASGNQLTADLLAYLGEVDHRRLYLDAAFPSMFAYCVEVLNLSEGATCKRIAAARAARRFPAILRDVRSGRLHLCGVQLLARHLTPDNCQELLEAASGLSKRQTEKLLAARFPAPDVPPAVRRLPRRRLLPLTVAPLEMMSPKSPRPADDGSVAGTSAQTQAVASPAASSPPLPAPRRPPDVLAPLSERRYKVQFTVDQATYDKLREAQNLLGHRVENGDLAEVFDRALELLVKDIRKKKFAETDRPRKPAPAPVPAEGTPVPEPRAEPEATAKEDPTANEGRRGRYIPAAIRRAVAQRDGHQCTYVDPQTGRRCASCSDLQYHHEQPWAEGGRHSLENVRLRCRPHNLHAARQDFGQELIARRIAVARGQAISDRAEGHLPRGRDKPDGSSRACEGGVTIYLPRGRGVADLSGRACDEVVIAYLPRRQCHEQRAAS